MSNELLRALGVEHPIIQAPMGGANVTPPALVAAVSNAGGLGSVGAAYMPPDQIAREGRAIRELTARPFGMNLFVPIDVSPPESFDAAIAQLAPYHAELGLPAPTAPALPTYSFDDQLAAVLDSGARVFSFAFGLLPTDTVRAIKERGLFVVGTATTVEEAVLHEQTGVDAVAAQGSEAGAHRGTFAASFESAMIGTMALVPQIARAVRIPVIAAGGIMTGAGIAAALNLGASAAQMGTAFLVTDECGIVESHKRAILSVADSNTRVTRAFSGRPARGIVNRALDEIERANAERPGVILPYPYQNALTRAMRAEAARQDRPDFLSLWAGQGVRLARRMPAGALVATLVRELAQARGDQRIT
jgi:nitronate monooxygenase